MTLIFEPSVLSCPCGCGTGLPSSLSQIETFRVSTKLESVIHQGSLDEDHLPLQELEPSSTLLSSVQLTHRIATPYSMSMDVKVAGNYHEDEGLDTSLADPTFGLIYQASIQNSDSYSYQPSFFIGHKPRWSKGMHSPTSSRNRIDIHGNGYQEYLAGAILAMNQDRWGLNISGLLNHRLPITQSIGTSTLTRVPALIFQSSLTLNYGWPGLFSVGGILSHDIGGDHELNQVILKDSGFQNTSTTAYYQIKTAPLQSLTFAIGKRGYSALDFNSPMNYHFTVTWTMAG